MRILISNSAARMEGRRNALGASESEKLCCTEQARKAYSDNRNHENWGVSPRTSAGFYSPMITAHSLIILSKYGLWDRPLSGRFRESTIERSAILEYSTEPHNSGNGYRT